METDFEKKYQAWSKEEKAAFKGWDFSRLDGRWEAEALPWLYEDLVKAHLSPEMRLLDMGTGGGEFLLTLKHPYEKTTVTEAHPPNIALLQKTLAPMGITVVPVKQDDILPMGKGAVDLVINRHESFVASEVFRVLKPGGFFITQQVGGQNNRALSETLIEGFKPAYPNWDLVHVADTLEQAGFEVLKKEEYFPKLTFWDTSAVVYFAKIIEWEFPGFGVEKCVDALKVIDKKIENSGFYVSTEHRFMLVAKKPEI